MPHVIPFEIGMCECVFFSLFFFMLCTLIFDILLVMVSIFDTSSFILPPRESDVTTTHSHSPSPFDMLWSLACNIAKRLLFETNNIASTVNMKPSSFYSISTMLYILPFSAQKNGFRLFIVFFFFFFFFFIPRSFSPWMLFVIYFSHLYILHRRKFS